MMIIEQGNPGKKKYFNGMLDFEHCSYGVSFVPEVFERGGGHRMARNSGCVWRAFSEEHDMFLND